MSHLDNEDYVDMHYLSHKDNHAPRPKTSQPSGGMVMSPAGMNADQIRAVQEVQGRLMLAKSFPRDTAEAARRILEDCKRITLAESAIYTYPRGGTKVEGPSIRLAEALAQRWGNLDCGVDELSQGNGVSKIEAYAMDLETNTRFSKKFQVVHERHTKNGVTKLTDPRDIYETVANQGARRLRACIMAAIPGDVVDAAVEACRGTIVASQSEPLSTRVKAIATRLAEYGVTVAMIETRLGHNLPATTEHEWVLLKGILQSLDDGMSEASAHFDLGKGKSAPASTGGTQSAKDKLAKAKPQASAPAQETTLPEDYLALRNSLIDAFVAGNQDAWWESNADPESPYEIPLTMWWYYLGGGGGKTGWKAMGEWVKNPDILKAIEACQGTETHAMIVAEKAAIKREVESGGN